MTQRHEQRVPLILAGVGATVVLVVLAVVVGTLLPRSSASDATARPATGEEPTSTVLRTTTSRRPTARPQVGWMPWQPPDRSFTIDFTGAPEVRQLDTDAHVIAQAYSATDRRGDRAYQVSWYDVAEPHVLADPDFVLDGMVDATARSADFTITTRSLGRFAGNPSLDFEGEAAAGRGTTRVRGLEFIAGQRVYLFLAVGGANDSTEFDHFRDSFHLGG